MLISKPFFVSKVAEEREMPAEDGGNFAARLLTLGVDIQTNSDGGHQEDEDRHHVARIHGCFVQLQWRLNEVRLCEERDRSVRSLQLRKKMSQDQELQIYNLRSTGSWQGRVVLSVPSQSISL